MDSGLAVVDIIIITVYFIGVLAVGLWVRL